MEPKIYFNGNIHVEIQNKKIALDPEKSTEADLIFISHAHLDHTPILETVTPKICTKATRDLIQYRKEMEMINTINFDSFDINGIHIKQINSGHVTGSTSLLIETKNKKMFYSGDICDKHRFHLKAAEIPKSDIMIIESTFGKEKYQFPNILDTIDKSIKWIKEQLESKNSVVLMGYPLGKAQIISKIAENFNIPVIVHNSIYYINEICKRYGFDGNGYFSIMNYLDVLKKEQFIGIFPCSSKHIMSAKSIESKFPIKTAAFSGWALEENYKDELGVDEAFVLSDHADFNGLLKIIKQSYPEKVYTFHGFEIDFAEIIKDRLGIDARPLTQKTGNLSDFI
ncbi:MAG: MBL fold metallo-hydrolase [Candidatus Aenigmatarchaeota archaeon]